MRSSIRTLRRKANLTTTPDFKGVFNLYKDATRCLRFRYKVYLMMLQVFNGLIVHISILEPLKESANK